jgi:hypothetical protein
MCRALVGFLLVAALAACGSGKKSASATPADQCASSKDAATASTAVFFANSPTSQYPTTFNDLTHGTPRVMAPPKRVTVTNDAMTGDGWTLVMAGGGATAPTFTCRLS